MLPNRRELRDRLINGPPNRRFPSYDVCRLMWFGICGDP